MSINSFSPNKFLIHICFIFLTLFNVSNAIEITIPSNEQTCVPWFTGPLISPTPINMQPKHLAIEPSLTFFSTYGKYNSHWRVKKQEKIFALNPLVDFQFGITNNLGIETLVSFISNFQNKIHANHFQDTVILLGYQLLNEVKGSWIPNLRIDLQEIFPTGKYKKLSSNKNGIDSTGLGSFQTGPLLILEKMFYLSKIFFTFKISLSCLFPSKVYVKDFNTYGGGFGTKGRVNPGKVITSFVSAEYSINQRWVLAFDTEFLYQQKSTFSGYNGVTSNGDVAKVRLPSFFQVSLAPQIEYSFSPSSGIIIGVWATLIGRNSPAFFSGFLAYLCMF